jgi:hypothetical protein
MVRFQCIHCGGRIAVPDDHMDRLARCPECGGVTHPLAAHIKAPDTGKNPVVKTDAGPAPTQLKPVDPTSVCDNCGIALGKLQKPFEWDGHFVCGPCHRMLSLEKAKPAVESVTAMVVTPPESGSLSEGSSDLIDKPRRQGHPSDFVIALRTACIGLCIIAVALYVIVSVLQSLGYLFMWGAIGLVVLAAVYWIRKGWMALRKRSADARADSTRELGV